MYITCCTVVFLCSYTSCSVHRASSVSNIFCQVAMHACHSCVSVRHMLKLFALRNGLPMSPVLRRSAMLAQMYQYMYITCCTVVFLCSYTSCSVHRASSVSNIFCKVAMHACHACVSMRHMLKLFALRYGLPMSLVLHRLAILAQMHQCT